MAVRVKPAETISRGPRAWSIFEPVRPAAMAENTSGSIRTPVSRGLIPRTSWRYWTAISWRPTRASMASTMQPTEVPNAGRANSRISISGCSRRRWRRTKTISSSVPRTIGPSVAGPSSADPLPMRLTPRTMPSTPSAAMIAPMTSQGPLRSPRDSGSSQRPTSSITAIIGMLMRKTEPHQ